MLIELLLVIVGLGFLIWRWGTSTFHTFKDRGIPYEKPTFLCGNTNIASKNFSFLRLFIDFYERNKHHKIVGFYHLRSPFFMVNDPELIKKICVKDFDYFRNHLPPIQTHNEPLWEKMVMNLDDQAWKDMRNSLSPAFTANKMRTMFTLMEDCFDMSIDYLKGVSKDNQPIDLEMKECFARLSNDIIASTAFGIKLNSYKDRENQFYKIGQALTNFRGKQIFKLTITNTAPFLSKLLGIKVFDSESCKYFTRLVCDAIKYREEHNIVRPDMIQLLMEAQKVSGKQWSDIDLVAQCFIFFFAAFENNSNLIALTCYELMKNPDEQQRLYEEVLATHEELNGAPINYDVVNKMQYMDMVVSEVLRKWNFGFVTNRICSKDYDLTDADGNLVFHFKKGDLVWIPLMGLSLDEQYFEEPYKFNPERFNPAYKDNIRPFTNIPFGAGPRNCIGNRYALMQGKAMLYHLLLNYSLEKCEKSLDNLFDHVRDFTFVPKEGIWVRFVPRKKSEA